MKKILSFIDSLNEWTGRVLSYMVLIMFLLVISEVVLRYLFNAPTVWTNELTQLLFGVYVILSGGYLLKHNGHVNVDILYTGLGDRGRAILDIITFPLFMMFGVMLLVYGGLMAWESIQILEHSESAWNPPIYPVKAIIPIGALLLVVQGLSKLVKDIATVIKGRSETPAQSAERETL